MPPLVVVLMTASVAFGVAVLLVALASSSAAGLSAGDVFQVWTRQVRAELGEDVDRSGDHERHEDQRDQCL